MDKPKSKLSTAGDLRTFLANIAMGAIHGEIDKQEAIIAVKACEQINTSLYSEAKIWALVEAAGGKLLPLGHLPIGVSETPVRQVIEDKRAA